jgi:integrase
MGARFVSGRLQADSTKLRVRRAIGDGTLRWDDLSLERGTATLPDTKTGRSQRAIGAPARMLLAGLPRVDGSPFVFPGSSNGPLATVTRVWYASRHAAKLDNVRLRDLRYAFASVSASSGGSLLLIGKLLGHHDTATTAKYAHLLDDPVRRAADAAAEQIAEWLSPRSATSTSSIDLPPDRPV